MLAALYFFSIFLGAITGALDRADDQKWRADFEHMLGALDSLETLFAQTGSIAEQWRAKGIKGYVVLGTGPNYGTMVEGALKICEFSWRFGAGEELEDFAHGRFREVGGDDVLIILAPTPGTIEKTLDLLTGCYVSHTSSILLTAQAAPVLRKLATYLVEMPNLENEYLTPFAYVFPLWFLGYHLREKGELVGEKRHGLYAVDIHFAARFDENGDVIGQ